MRVELIPLAPTKTSSVFGPSDYSVRYDAFIQETGVDFEAGTQNDTMVTHDGGLSLFSETITDTVNLALGRVVTGDVSGSNLSRVTDGSTSSGYVTLTPDGVPHFIRIDLGSVQMIGKIKMWHYFASPRKYKGNKLEVSADGNNWVTVFDSATHGEYTETADGKTVEFLPVNARYVRNWLSGSDANTGSHWVEIEVYGAPPDYRLSGDRKSPGYEMTGTVTEHSTITWQADVPAGTTLEILAAVTESNTAPLDADYYVVSNGDLPPGLAIDDDATGKYIWFWEKLNTTDPLLTPKLIQLDVNILTASAPALPIQLTFDRVWLESLPTPSRIFSSPSPLINPGETATWSIDLAHGFWFWRATGGGIQSALQWVQATQVKQRVLYQLTNRAKVVTWTNKRALYQLTNCAKTVAWTKKRSLYQYPNYTDDPPFPRIDRLSTNRGLAGQSITIYGSGFGYTDSTDPANPERFLRGYGGRVYIGPLLCGVIEWSWDRIVAQIPEGAESGAIRVRLLEPSPRDSNLKGFEVAEGLPATDVGIELFICDKTNPNSILAQISGAKSKAFQVMRNNAGSGSFSISLQDPVGGDPNLLANDNLVLVKLDGKPVFKWIIEQRNPTYVDNSEQTMVSVSGRGALSLLDRAVVYPENMGSPQLDRSFTGTAPTILRQLILEAQHRGGLGGVVVDWVDDQDSIGNIFTEIVSLSFHVGTPLSEVLSKFTAGLGYFDIEMSPSLVLKIYRDRGIDQSDTIIYRPGQAVFSQQNQYNSSKMVNEVLVEGKDRKLAIAANPISQAQYGRREGFLSAGNVPGGLGEYGQAYLNRAAFPAWSVQGEVVQFQDESGQYLRPLESFFLGDWITWTVAPEGYDSAGFREKLRVTGVTVKEADDTNLVTYSLDLNNTILEHEIRLNQKVERMTQFTGSDVLSSAPSSGNSYSESEVQQLLDQKAEINHKHVFRDLLDAPDSYTGQAGKVVVVNPDENGLVFQSMEGGGGGGNSAFSGPLLKAEDILEVAVGTGIKSIVNYNLTPDIQTAFQYNGAASQTREDVFSFTCGAGIFRIWYGHNTENASYDYFRFFIDGVALMNNSGGVSLLLSLEKELTAGTHEFKMTYRKDGSGNGSGYDGFRIYAINYPSP